MYRMEVQVLNTVNEVAAPIATFETGLRLAARKASPSARAVVKPSAWSSSPIITFRAVENLAPADDNVSGRRSSSLSMRSARSEEHTSELQSLMRISYAVFCLKKKKKKQNNKHTQLQQSTTNIINT